MKLHNNLIINSLILVLIVLASSCSNLKTDNKYLGLKKFSVQAKRDFDRAAEALRNNDLLQAEIIYKDMIEKYPELSVAAYNLAVLKRKQGEHEQAQQYLTEAIKRNMYNFDARNLQAIMYRENNKFTEAEQEYLAIIGFWGGYNIAYKNLGILYDLYMGNYKKALQYYKMYNSRLEEPDAQVVNWIADLNNRL